MWPELSPCKIYLNFVKTSSGNILEICLVGFVDTMKLKCIITRICNYLLIRDICNFQMCNSFPFQLVADQLQPVAALESRRRLRSSARLDIPRVRRTTIGDRAFCVAGPCVWNSFRHRRRVHLRCLFLGGC